MREKNAVMIAIAAAVAVVDGVFKFFANSYLSETAAKPPLDFVLHKNFGITFNIPIPMPIILGATACIIAALIYFIVRERKQNPEQSTAALMIVLGAANNAVDRACNNYTTDYIVILGRSAINLSDILIVLGALLFLYYNERNPRTGAKA